MQSTNIISITAIVLSAVAIGLSSVGSSGLKEESVSRKEVRKIVQEELLLLEKEGGNSQEIGLRKDNKVFRIGQNSKQSSERKVRSLVANEVKDQIKDLVESGEVNMLVGSSAFNQNEKVDVSHLDSTKDKVKFILAKFNNVNSLYHDSEVLAQLIEFGDEAIPFLLEGKKNNSGHWGPGWAATQTLSKMLTEDHKDIILENFKKNSDFPELILKYGFPEAEELVFKKITSNKDYLDESIIEAALDYDPIRAEETLRNFILDGQYVAGAAEALLARDSGIDIKNELKAAALNCDETWQKSQLSNVLVGQGMKEGLGLALDAYENSDDSHSKKEVLKLFRKSVDFSGSSTELLKFVKDNKDRLIWDDKSRRFK